MLQFVNYTLTHFNLFLSILDFFYFFLSFIRTIYFLFSFSIFFFPTVVTIVFIMTTSPEKTSLPTPSFKYPKSIKNNFETTDDPIKWTC